MPRRVIDQGVSRWAWAVTLADPSAPSTVELEAAVDLSCLAVTGSSEVRADASDTVSEKAICETANADTPTASNYIGNLVLFRQWDDLTGDWDATDPRVVFPRAGIFGFVVIRDGFATDEDWENGQLVQVYKFVTDNPQFSGGSGEGNQKLTVPLLKQGVMHLDAVVGGVASSSSA